MEKTVKQICLWINASSQLSKTIEQNKMSQIEVKTLFEVGDTRRKGYLDLKDVFHLAGKVTQSQLFAIFKFMDTQRTGTVRLQQLQSAFGSLSQKPKHTAKEYVFQKFYAITDAIKSKLHMTKNYKQKYGLTIANLKLAYQFISNLAQTKYLTCQELITVMKSQSIKLGIKWGNEQQKTIQEFFSDHLISEAKFLQFFTNESKQRVDVQEECLLSGLQSDNLSTRNQKSQRMKPNLKNINISSYQQQRNPRAICGKVTNVFQSSPNDTPSFRTKPTQNCQTARKQEEYQFSNPFVAIEQDVNNILSSIQQRKLKLKQDSLDRKRLVDDVIKRTKQFFVASKTSTSIAQKENFFRKSDHQCPKKDLSFNKSQQMGESFYNQAAPYDSQITNSYKTPEFVAIVETPQNIQEANTSKKEKPSLNELKLTLERQLGNIIRKEPKTFTNLDSQQPKYENKEALGTSKHLVKGYSKMKQAQGSGLKHLIKSKSGFIFSKPSTSYQLLSKEPKSTYETNYFQCQRQFSTHSSKQNAFKKVQEEAERRIHEIQKKARIKVFEKKSTSRTNKEEWGKIVKRAHFF